MKKSIKVVCVFLSLIISVMSAMPTYAATLTKRDNTHVSTVIESKTISNGAFITRVIQTNDYVIISSDREDKVSAINMNCDSQNRVLVATAYIPKSGIDTCDLYEELAEEAETMTTQTGSSSLTGSDKNFCASFNITVNYTKYNDGYDTYFKIGNISGGFSDSGTSGSYVGENVYVTALSLTIAQIGNSQSGNWISSQILNNVPLSVSRTWRYQAPTSWMPVSALGFGASVGVTYYFTLTRGASSWTSNLQINILDVLNTI